MDTEEDTFEWLGMPSPLETYKQHVGLLEEEILELNLQLRKARENIRGLVQMNDELSASKARADADLKKALTNVSRLNHETSAQGNRILSLMMVSRQRDDLLNEIQDLRAKLREIKNPSKS